MDEQLARIIQTLDRAELIINSLPNLEAAASTGSVERALKKMDVVINRLETATATIERLLREKENRNNSG